MIKMISSVYTITVTTTAAEIPPSNPIWNTLRSQLEAYNVTTPVDLFRVVKDVAPYQYTGLMKLKDGRRLDFLLDLTGVTYITLVYTGLWSESEVVFNLTMRGTVVELLRNFVINNITANFV